MAAKYQFIIEFVIVTAAIGWKALDFNPLTRWHRNNGKQRKKLEKIVDAWQIKYL